MNSPEYALHDFARRHAFREVEWDDATSLDCVEEVLESGTDLQGDVEVTYAVLQLSGGEQKCLAYPAPKRLPIEE